MASVLLVDPDAALRAGLEARGHDVIEARGPEAGEERLREGGIDVVVVPFEIAGGIEAFVQAMDHLPDPPPFVLLAGTVEGPKVSARIGAAAFLAKPCSPTELHAVIERMVPGARSTPPFALDDQPTRPNEKTKG